MIITDITINNLYCFDDFYVDFSYPRKINSSTIDCEFLEERPNFNIKRFCVIMGSNSSGKTSFGKVLCGIAYSREDLKNYKIHLDSSVKKRSDYYTTAIGIDNKLAIKTNNFLASFMLLPSI